MIYWHIFRWWCRCFLTMSWSGRFFNVIQTSFFDFFFFGSGHWSSSIWQRTWEQSQIINTLATTEKNMFLRLITTNLSFFLCVFTYQDRTSIEFKLVVEELEDLVKIVVVSALLLILSSSIWIPMVGTDKNSILRKSLGFGIPEGGLWVYSVMLQNPGKNVEIGGIIH